MPTVPFEYDLVHADGREELVRVDGKTLLVTSRLGGKVTNESRQVHRFAPQAKEAAKAHAWEARERGFDEQKAVESAASSKENVPDTLTLYRVTATAGRGTWQRGDETTYLLDGKRLRTNDAIQEFESEDDARSALERMIRPSDGYTLQEEQVSREIGGLSGKELTDMLAHNVTHFERSEAEGRIKIRFRESARDTSRYAELINAMAQSRAATVHLFCEVDGSPNDAWTSALATDLPFRNLIFDTDWETLTRQQEHSLGDLALTLCHTPNLERMFISGNVRTSPLEHSILRELYLLGDPLNASVLHALAESSLPGLQKLVLCLRQESSADHDVQVVEALRQIAAPALSVLCLYGVDKPIQVAVELARARPSLRALVVDGSILEEQLVELTEDDLAALSELAYLELDLEGFEPSPALRERLPHLHALNPGRILPAEYESW